MIINSSSEKNRVTMVDKTRRKIAARMFLAGLFILSLIVQQPMPVYGAEDPYSQVSQADIEAAGSQLLAMGQPDINCAGQPLNYGTFVIYRIVAYGDPNGDSKTDSDGMLQRRYLGYDYQGTAITNDLFPPDKEGTADLQDKIWIPNDRNFATWGAAFQHAGLKEYMLSVKVLNDGRQTGLSMTEILARRPVVDWQEKLDYMKVMSMPSVEMNGTIQLRQANGYYDTFTLPAIKSMMRPKVVLSTEKEQYTMEPDEAYLDIDVDVTGGIDYGMLPESCMKVIGVRYLGYEAPRGDRPETAECQGSYGKFTVRLFRSDLQDGLNAVMLNGEGEFDSVFPADPHPIVKTASKQIALFVGAAEELPPAPPPETEPEPVEISVEADLELPDVTYEGHPTPAKDASVFYVDDARCSARKAYESGYGRNRFSVPDSGAADIRRIDLTEAEITFRHPGTYTGRLEVKPDGGTTQSDQERIEVRGTPEIIASLGGVQKENRKQVLDISIAMHPEYPLADFYVELQQVDGAGDETASEAGGTAGWRIDGSTIRLDREHTQQNSDMIKTRPMMEQESEMPCCFAEYRIEFLTKGSGTFQYRIFAEDLRGHSDLETREFDVVPDLAPEAAILIQPQYLRDEKSNNAIIQLEDGTIMKDGDQLERSWEVTGPPGSGRCDFAYDLSFGTKKKVCFRKGGVGPLEARLFVRERWTEPTLEEYVTPVDRKTSEATATSEVVNIAPVVSLTPLDTVRSSLLIFAAGDAEYQKLNDPSVFQQEFIRNGIDARIRVEKLAQPAYDMDQAVADTAASPLRSPGSIFAVESAYGYEGRWTFLEKNGYAIDDERVYTIEASWPGTDSADYPEMPCKLSAYGIKASYESTEKADGNEGNGIREWTCMIDSDLMEIGRQSQVNLMHDDTGAFLYLVCDGRTMLIDKKTGSVMTVLDFETGIGNYDTDRYIYTVKESGVYAIDKFSGSAARKLAPPAGCYFSNVSRRIGGQIGFLASGTEKAIAMSFDPETGKAAMSHLTGTENDSPLVEYGLLGIDCAGNMAVGFEKADGSMISGGVRIYGRSHGMVKEIIRNSTESSRCLITPVCDEAGIYTYMAFSRKRKSSSRYYFEVEAVGIRNDERYSFSDRQESGYLCKNECIFARDSGGKIYLAYGSIWDYIHSAGYDYDERCALLVADPASGSMTLADRSVVGLQSTDEYGRDSSMYAAVQCSGNSPAAPAFRTRVLAWPQSRWHQIGRSVEKFLAANQESKYVIISDMEGAGDLSADTAATEYVKELKKSVMQKIAASDAEFIFDRKADAAELRDRIIEERNDRISILGITPISQDASIKKPIRLGNGRRYFFEYDVRLPEELFNSSDNAKNKCLSEMLCVEFGVSHELPQDRLENGGFHVTGMKKEDFSDSGTNPFFSLGSTEKINDGVYKACDAGIGNSDTNHVRTFNDTIRFAVPEGRKAILAFDYEYDIYDDFIIGNGVEIDGAPWDADLFKGPAGAGRYMHPKILGEGSHDMKMELSYYGRLPEDYKLHIDDLTVLFIEDMETDDSAWVAEDQPDMAAAKIDSVAEPIGDGWYHMSGTIMTPPSVLAFRPQPMEYWREGFEDEELIPYLSVGSNSDQFDYYIKDGQYTHPPGQSCDGALVFDIPAGRSSRATLDTWSVINRQSVVYALGERRWVNGIRSSSRDDYRYMGSPYTISLPVLNARQQVTIENGYRDRTGVEGLDLMVFDSNPLTEEGRYFYDTDQEKIYLETDITSEEASLRFVIPKCDAGAEGGIGDGDDVSNTFGIQNLKLYEVENGVRNYILDDYYSEGKGTGGWESSGAETDIRLVGSGAVEGPTKLVFKKGELVSYDIGYYDYESDPSKRQYWRYTHQPFNDGPHPDAGKVLERPIDRFQIDGKYRVEHWQEDSTGDPAYDKLSNIEELTFYIEGSGNAPWIESINTVPSTIRVGSQYMLRILVDDSEKDPLSLETEIYDRGGKLVSSYINGSIEAVNGRYPPIDAGPAAAVKPGRYRVVATVRDNSGAGIGSISFSVVSDCVAEGMVRHTDQWDLNRREYNVLKFGTEENTESQDYGLGPRGRLVFWPGEKFVLYAGTTGDVISVKAEILGEPEYQCGLVKDKLVGTRFPDLSAEAENGAVVTEWTGELWDERFIGKWGKEGPEEVTIRFTAIFNGSEDGAENGATVRICDRKIIVYAPEDFWQLHRAW